MDASAPPSYRRYSTRPGPAPVSNELPPYTRRHTLTQPAQVATREPTEHKYQINDGKVTLKIYSSAKSSKSLPTFFEKEKITGHLEVTAERGNSIHAVHITITGRVITGSSLNESFVFLNHTIPVWSRSSDTPRLPSPSEGTAGAKLLGHCVWPLSIALPRTVEVSTGSGETRVCRLPETFLERHTPVSVQYDLALHISKGKLKSDSQIKTAFGYVPSTRPGPPSLLRQLAYQQGCPLPNPSTDPEGWKILRPVSCRGAMKSGRVDVRCILGIAQPLSFTRGSVIPLCLTIEGPDKTALDALSKPSSVVVSLRRRVRFYNQSTYARADVAWNETVEDMSTASWWPSETMQSSPYVRHLEGEIRLPKDLRPSSDMGHFSISYSVVLSPFAVAGFHSDSATTLICEPVEIATMHARGPRATPYSPPAYDPLACGVRHGEGLFQASVHGHIMVA